VGVILQIVTRHQPLIAFFFCKIPPTLIPRAKHPSARRMPLLLPPRVGQFDSPWPRPLDSSSAAPPLNSSPAFAPPREPRPTLGCDASLPARRHGAAHRKDNRSPWRRGLRVTRGHLMIHRHCERHCKRWGPQPIGWAPIRVRRIAFCHRRVTIRSRRSSWRLLVATRRPAVVFLRASATIAVGEEASCGVR
jgi:hypothetical protein